MSIIKADLDTTMGDAKLAEFRNRIMQVQGEMVNTENRNKAIFQQARRATNMILVAQKQNAAIAAIMAAQNVLLTGLSIQRVAKEAAAAFALGPAGTASGLLLTSIGIGMAANLVAAQQAQLQSKRQADYMQTINEMRDMYS